MPSQTLQLGTLDHQLRDRFQGAVLGLMLSPVAVFLHLARTQRGAQAQYHALQAAQSLSAWLEALPAMLRYHRDSSKNRHIKMLQASVFSHEACAVTAQYLVLSDLIAWVLDQRQPQLSTSSSLELSFDASPLDLRLLADEIIVNEEAFEKYAPPAPSSLHHHYYGLWTNLVSSLHEKKHFQPADSVPPFLRQPVLLTVPEQKFHQYFVAGVYSAVLPFENDCCTSYQQSIAAAIAEVLPANSHQGYQLALLVAGLMAGTIHGRKGLPTHWQQRNIAKEIFNADSIDFNSGVVIADKCFAQWRGLQTSYPQTGDLDHLSFESIL